MMDSKEKGDLAEAVVQVRMMELGLSISKPVSEKTRYDFIIDTEDGDFIRAQCKTGRYRNGSVKFQVSSLHFNTNTMEKRDYHGEVDGFLVHCFEIDESYYVPIENVGSSQKNIRVEETDAPNVDWADKYLLENRF